MVKLEPLPKKPKLEFIEPENDQEPDQTSDHEPDNVYVRPIPQNDDHIVVKVTGLRDGINMKPITSFKDAELSEELLTNIKDCKWNKPTPIQKYVIPIALQGRDLMGCSQTGSGKTGAYIILRVAALIAHLMRLFASCVALFFGKNDNAPILIIPIIKRLMDENIQAMAIGPNEKIEPQCLILTPTKELAMKINIMFDKLTKNTLLKSHFIIGGYGNKNQRTKFRNGCNILIATPGRLREWVRRRSVELDSVQFLIIDDADRVLETYEADLNYLLNCKLPDKESRQTLMFSAKFPDRIQRKGLEYLTARYAFINVGVPQLRDYWQEL